MSRFNERPLHTNVGEAKFKADPNADVAFAAAESAVFFKFVKLVSTSVQVSVLPLTARNRIEVVMS
jgi:hypothetical protein